MADGFQNPGKGQDNRSVEAGERRYFRNTNTTGLQPQWGQQGMWGQQSPGPTAQGQQPQPWGGTWGQAAQGQQQAPAQQAPQQQSPYATGNSGPTGIGTMQGGMTYAPSTPTGLSTQRGAMTQPGGTRGGSPGYRQTQQPGIAQQNTEVQSLPGSGDDEWVDLGINDWRLTQPGWEGFDVPDEYLFSLPELDAREAEWMKVYDPDMAERMLGEQMYQLELDQDRATRTLMGSMANAGAVTTGAWGSGLGSSAADWSGKRSGLREAAILQDMQNAKDLQSKLDETALYRMTAQDTFRDAAMMEGANTLSDMRTEMGASAGMDDEMEIAPHPTFSQDWLAFSQQLARKGASKEYIRAMFDTYLQGWEQTTGQDAWVPSEIKTGTVA